MDNLLQPQDYYSPEVYQNEMRTVFSKAWVCVGLKRDLNNNGDWITAKVGDTAVTIQNAEGTLVALHNVCSHRFAIMRTAEKGSTPLTCPYHGWMYSEEGKIIAIPARPRFSDLTEEKICELQLKQFSVECCSEFIFVRLSATGPSLKEFCSGVYDEVEKFGNALGSELRSSTTEFEANWKVVVENSIESYHAILVHPETFGTDRSYRFKITNAENCSSYEESISPAAQAKWSRISSAFASRPINSDSYLFHSIFPTFSIDTLRGATFSFNIIRPISVCRTAVISRGFATRLNPRELETKSLVKALNSMSVDSGPLVIGQDKVICENVQEGLNQSSRPGLLSEEETRIYNFHQSYKTF